MGGKSGNVKTEAKPLDTSKTKPSVRGTLIPYILGPARIGPIFGAVGGRSTYLKVTGTTAGGKGGKKKRPTFTTYYREKGWHILCLGRMKSIRVLTGDGYVTGKLTRDLYPSGSSISTTTGTFRVYWGLDDQPSDPFLSSQFGFASTWPNIAYVVWDSRELGTSATWPSVEYEIEVEGQLDTAFDKPAYISESSYSVPNIYMTHTVPSDEFFTTADARVTQLRSGYSITNSELGYSAVVDKIEAVQGGWKVYVGTYAPFSGTYAFDAVGNARTGMNPAAMLYQLLFSPSPFGLGRSEDDFEMSDFNALATKFASDGQEPFPCKTLLTAGTTFKEGISRVLLDIGAGWWTDQNTGRERLTLVREELSGATFVPKVYEHSDVDIEYAYATLAPVNTVFTYDDVNRKFQRSTIRESDDGAIQLSEDPASNKVELHSVSDFDTAQAVVSRRTQEILSVEEIPLKLPSEYIGMQMGGVYEIDGLPSRYRVKSKSVSTVDYKVNVVFVKDVYSGTSDFILQEQTNFSAITKGAFPDKYPRLVEITRLLAPDGGGVMYLRMRAHSQITGTTLLCSPDGNSYLSQQGSQQPCAGGILTSSILSSDPVLIEQGPVIDIIGPDIFDVGDLTSSEMLWRSGSQVMVINNEIFYLQSVTALSATQYRLNGLIRARLGTDLQTHSEGDIVYITSSDQFIPLYPEYLVKGASIYLKSLTETSKDQLDPDQVTAISTVYKGGGLVPMRVVNLNTSEDNLAWEVGQDVTIRWSYKNANNQSGAGILRSGQTGVPELPESYFVVSFQTSLGEVKRTETVVAASTYVYSNATMVSDFGLEPTKIKVSVASVLNGLFSEPVTVEFNKI